MNISRLIPALCILALSACATPTVYAPAKSATAPGYAETRIEENRFRIAFRGGSGEAASRVKDLALLRAADLALANGFDWFQVVSGYGEEMGSGGPTMSVGGGSTSFGGHSAVGVGLGTSFSLSGGPTRTETIEVLMGKGSKPEGLNAYDAKAVRASIGSTLK
jgi:hypothetical protein